MATKATADNDVHVALTRAVEAERGAYLVQQAQGLIIQDKADHVACREFLKGAKDLKRTIEAHYAAIKGPINAARATILDMERKDLAPVLQAIDVADKIDTAYVREQRRIEEQAAEDTRLKAEAEEVKRRQKQAARDEAEALKLESSSDALSERELIFVSAYLTGDRSPHAILNAAKLAKYADPIAAAARLMKSEKISIAIRLRAAAARIRQESEAKQAAPINVEVVTKASEIVDGGVQTYYGCESFNTEALLAKLYSEYAQPANVLLRADVDRFLGPALLVLMSAQARRLKELFPQSWPMCKLAKRDGTTSR